MPIVTIVGSTNTDLVIKTPRLPAAGETVKGTDFQIFFMEEKEPIKQWCLHG